MNCYLATITISLMETRKSITVSEVSSCWPARPYLVFMFVLGSAIICLLMRTVYEGCLWL